jgi:hypothetical protein
MKVHCNVSNWNGLAALACLLLIHGFAGAACTNVSPAFTYIPVVPSGGQSTIEVSAPAGCFWEVVRQPEWIKIISLNRGFGSGSIVFQVLLDKKDTLSTGFLRVIVRDLDRRQTNTVDLPISHGPLQAGIQAIALRTTFPRTPVKRVFIPE